MIDHAQLTFYVLALILPLSALLARRLPLKTVLGMAVFWIALFAVGLAIASLGRDRLHAAWTMFAGNLTDQTVTGREVRIRMGADGHFYADARINGVARRMLIDSGATTTAISVGTAQAAGLNVGEDPFPQILHTANGMVTAKMAKAAEIQVGTIRARDLSVVVAPEFGDSDVIGMNFLSRLKSWRVEGDILVLTPTHE